LEGSGHTLDPKVGIISAHSDETTEARAVTAERDVVAVFPDILVAEGGKGG
jgi:hypothetical protein